MRDEIHTGTIQSWGGGGFGWVREHRTNRLWFAHVQAFRVHPGYDGPPVGMRVRFMEGQDGTGRRRAAHIEQEDQ
ncbi:MAG: hypothetical protein IT179_14425 [Acidobacteria bacterium]|nr:hypothetical protein [Acidobacteriota bacterium]